ncbi:MAG: hypothetical protein IJT28_05550 [Bacteroidaceae bacterium]|nr:hypothetical protein [Bacteroidaceae bacterium]
MNLTKKVKKSSTVKELFFTFIATTFSIILTFGTSRYFEYREKRASGRQTAIHVILDMEENIRQLDELADNEEEQFNLLHYVLGHIEEIDSLSADTLEEAYFYLVHDNDIKFDDSREKIFHSSQDSWKHINNPKFIDLVQTFYYNRHQLENHYNSDPVFREPISNEEHYQYMLQYVQYDSGLLEGLPELLPKLLEEPRIEFYITYSPARQKYYRDAANEWRVISDQCKFFMGITNEELIEYVEKSEHSGSIVSKKQLIGTWTADVSEENEEITFRKDGTFTHTMARKLRGYLYSGAAIRKGYMEGTWFFEGDTLVRVYPRNKYHYEIDFSQISYNDEHKEEIEDYIKQYKENIENRNESYKNDTTTMERRNIAYINATGQMVELNRNTIDEDGNEQTEKSYMRRIKETK